VILAVMHKSVPPAAQWRGGGPEKTAAGECACSRGKGRSTPIICQEKTLSRGAGRRKAVRKGGAMRGDSVGLGSGMREKGRSSENPLRRKGGEKIITHTHTPAHYLGYDGGVTRGLKSQHSLGNDEMAYAATGTEIAKGQEGHQEGVSPLRKGARTFRGGTKEKKGRAPFCRSRRGGLTA